MQQKVRHSMAVNSFSGTQIVVRNEFVLVVVVIGIFFLQ